MNQQKVISSPLGEMLLCATAEALTGIYFIPQKHGRLPDPARQGDSPVLLKGAEELAAYFDGQLREFSVPLKLAGTAFQLQVWQALLTIPFGETQSYQQLANRLGKPSAVRAVANAVGRNPVSVIVPCHRIIGSNGALTGYAGGLPRKQALLTLEGVLPLPLGKNQDKDILNEK